MRVTAAVLEAHDQPFRLTDVHLDGPGPDEVLVRIAGTGFCHTDLLPRAPHMGIALPVIAGHEGAGVVEETGPQVTSVAPGDPVILSFDFCGGCRACLAARPANCATFFPRNLTGRRPDGSGTARTGDGRTVSASWFGQSSFAGHVVVPARAVVPVPADMAADVPLEILGPLGCGFQTGAGAVLNSLSVQPGSRVVVAGAGAVGLAAIMAAHTAGATAVVAVELHPARRRLAAELGATHVLDGADPDLGRELAGITGGADHVLDTTGVPSLITTLIDSLHAYGTCGLVGVQHGDLAVGPLLLAAGRTVKGIIEGDAVPRLFIPRLLGLWRQGRFPFDRLIRTYPLHDIARAERDTARGDVVKAVLLPS
ncbi:NAD(P)-dependent alcohol dehydrogenase [Streptomyces sp. NBC_00388]|uniref:NAD(P)-dependent alcohol dehydrogenase n=1 Tax=Streptomyces sp. NBC_00388 TaxID=2975735 RepID=UPI002E1D8822